MAKTAQSPEQRLSKKPQGKALRGAGTGSCTVQNSDGQDCAIAGATAFKKAAGAGLARRTGTGSCTVQNSDGQDCAIAGATAFKEAAGAGLARRTGTGSCTVQNSDGQDCAITGATAFPDANGGAGKAAARKLNRLTT